MKIKTVQENIDRCRFCFMCRHVCTLGRATKEEALTPRSQSLSLSYILRDTFGYSAELAENIYKCCLCNYCKDWCQGGWDFPSAVIAARADIVDADLVPDEVIKLKDEIIAYHNAYGVNELCDALVKEIKSSPGKADTLVIMGSDIKYKMPEAALAYLSILKRAGVEYTLLNDEDTTSFEMMMLGFTEEAKNSAEVFTEAVFDTECSKVIVLSPDVEGFISNEMLDLGLSLANIDIIGGIVFLKSLFDEGKLTFKKGIETQLTYHDCNAMARVTGAIDEPRDILSNIPGIEYKEMIWNKNEAHSAGSNLTNRLYPSLADDIAAMRFDDIMETDSEIVITSSVYDYAKLPELSEGKIKFEDFYVFVERLTKGE